MSRYFHLTGKNGERLHPDHGFPVRLIIPGYIGGRMIKWLSKITIAKQESQNFYHFNDNRVLPSCVPDASTANEGGWWYKPEYIINDLNVNSAISYPCHNDIVTVTPEKSFTMKGYAYTGGGNKITRVEISLNKGKSWDVAKLYYDPSAIRHQTKHWCWTLWEFPVTDIATLMRSEEIIVRAWDSCQNCQPEKLNWNVMGMMNNCWFRVKVHHKARTYDTCSTRTLAESGSTVTDDSAG